MGLRPLRQPKQAFFSLTIVRTGEKLILVLRVPAALVDLRDMPLGAGHVLQVHVSLGALHHLHAVTVVHLGEQ